MDILVTGGSGFIGSHVVDRLVMAGHRVRVADLRPPHRRDVAFVQADLTDREAAFACIEGVQVLFHVAAFSNIDLVKEHPIETVESNILGTAYLLEAARQAQVSRFIYASSVYVHNQRGHLYTTSKLASELLCKNYHLLYGLPYTILRFATAYGPRSRNADVVSIFVQRAMAGLALEVRGSGQQIRNFTYVQDLADGCVLALQEAAENNTYVIANSEQTSIRDLALIVKEEVNPEVPINFVPSEQREDDYGGEIADIHRASRELGWTPQYPLRVGIRAYRQWLESKPKGKEGHICDY